jgi:hypothetical protein
MLRSFYAAQPRPPAVVQGGAAGLLIRPGLNPTPCFSQRTLAAHSPALRRNRGANNRDHDERVGNKAMENSTRMMYYLHGQLFRRLLLHHFQLVPR